MLSEQIYTACIILVHSIEVRRFHSTIFYSLLDFLDDFLCFRDFL